MNEKTHTEEIKDLPAGPVIGPAPESIELGDRFTNWLSIKTLYHDEWRLQFKRRVPGIHRLWDPIGKVWLFEPSYRATVEAITRRYFLVRDGICWELSWDLLHLQRGAPDYVIAAVGQVLSEHAPTDVHKQRVAVAVWMALNL